MAQGLASGLVKPPSKLCGERAAATGRIGESPGEDRDTKLTRAAALTLDGSVLEPS